MTRTSCSVGSGLVVSAAFVTVPTFRACCLSRRWASTASREGIPEVSYPAVRYDHRQPALSARCVAAAAPADLVNATGEFRYLAGDRHGDPEIGVFLRTMTAQRSGPDPHFHRTMSESFYVLSGEVRIYDGRNWVPCTTGDFVHVPRGGVHGFKNESAAPSSMLIIFAPAGPRESYFEELAEIASSGRELDDDEWRALWTRHDQYPA